MPYAIRIFEILNRFRGRTIAWKIEDTGPTILISPAMHIERHGDIFYVQSAINKNLGECSIIFTKNYTFEYHSSGNSVQDREDLLYVLNLCYEALSIALEQNVYIHHIVFSASLGEPSRMKLYDHLAKRLATRVGGFVKTQKEGDSLEYYIILRENTDISQRIPDGQIYPLQGMDQETSLQQTIPIAKRKTTVNAKIPSPTVQTAGGHSDNL